MSLEAEFGLGLGGFAALPSHEQARLLAYWRIKQDPTGESSRTRTPKTTKGKIQQLRQAQGLDPRLPRRRR